MPMFFKDVIGQQAAKQRLVQSANEGRVSHAQLFSAPEGAGGLPLALAYAQYVSCQNKQATDSCGVCPSCKKYVKLIHPDLHFVFPVIKTAKYKEPVSDNFLEEWRKTVLQNAYFNLDDWFGAIGTENAQGLIYSHQSEEIIRKLSLKSFESEFKVMIIWMPEKMHVACANKLLKMIEEPPSKTLFLLIAEDEEEIISTIRSRCQLVKLPAIDEQSLKEAIKVNFPSGGGSVDNLVHLARGNYRRVQSLLVADETTQYNLEKFKELMRLAYGRKFLELFALNDELSGIGRERQKIFILYALQQIRENFVANMNQKSLVFMNDEEQQFSQKFSPFINERNIIQLTGEFEKAHLHIAMNGNPRIIFTDLSLRVVKLIRK